MYFDHFFEANWLPRHVPFPRPTARRAGQSYVLIRLVAKPRMSFLRSASHGLEHRCELLSALGREAGRNPHVMQASAIVVEAEQERPDPWGPVFRITLKTKSRKHA